MTLREFFREIHSRDYPSLDEPVDLQIRYLREQVEQIRTSSNHYRTRRSRNGRSNLLSHRV